eukprot:553011_1
MSETKLQKKIQRILTKIGLTNTTQIAQTLQGTIWRASQIHNNTTTNVVVKVTDINLHKQGVTLVNGRMFKVQEDILNEQSILKYLTQFEDCPSSIVKFRRFFQTSTHYYLIMSDGGNSLFDFISKAHNLIREGDIEISEWKRTVKVIYKQMIECVEYLHSKNVSHFDISLENFLINDVPIEVIQTAGDTKIKINADKIQIRLCDFGLAKLFTGNGFESDKFVGKKNYKSPEIVKRKNYNAKKNDIWCLGVCLLMMSLGTCAWTEANESDKCFRYIMEGKLVSLLVAWDILHYTDSHIIDLFESIFQYEPNRMCLKKMKQHPWFNTES